MQTTYASDQREWSAQDIDAPSQHSEKEVRECAALRQECLGQMRSLMSRTPMYTKKDFALEERGVRHFEETLQKEELEKNIRFIARTSERLAQSEQSFQRDITAAQIAGWLTSKTANHWIRKLHSSQYTWWEKVDFIENKFPRVLVNWQNLSRGIANVKKKAEENPKLLKISEVKTVVDGKLRGYKEWRATVDLATAKIAVFGDSRRDELLKTAQMRLEYAIGLKATTPQKANKWLRRIFTSTAKPEDIERFVNGKLGELTANWVEEKKRFDAIEGQRRKSGSPRTFHFVSLNVFLDFTYGQKCSYNNLAKHSIERMQYSHAIITELKREVAAEDWATAGHLLKDAQAADLSEKDREELTSLQQYIAHHRPKGPTSEERAESKQETRADVERDLEEAISELHPTLGRLMNTFIRKENYSTTSACLAAIYNFSWSHKHLYLNPDKLEELREQSNDETDYVKKYGDLGPRRMENLNLDGLREGGEEGLSNRQYGKGTEAATYLHVDSNSHDTFRRICRENAENHRWKYWVIVDFSEVPYSDQLHCATTMRHRLKSIKRRWDKATGVSQPRTATKREPQSAPTFASAA